MEVMRAALVYGINDMRVETVERPAAPDGSILIRVHSCAICGTDRRIYKAGDYRAEYPVITGHEIAGEVVELGKGMRENPPGGADGNSCGDTNEYTYANMSGYSLGDRVCVAPGHGCGRCAACIKGFPNVCVNPYPSLGYKLNGGFAEYMAVPAHILRLGFVNRLPESLNYDQASLSEITACCINAQNNVGISKGDTVLIIGAGPAGLIHAHLSKRNGAGRGIMAQRSRARLDMAMKLFPGIVDDVIAISEEDLEESLFKKTDGIGADAVLVCAPSREVQESAFKLAANRGRINFFGGLPNDDRLIRIDSNNLHYKELFVSGASSSLPETNREALKLLDERAIDPDKLITGRFGLDGIHEAFAAAEEKSCIKIVINP